MWRDGNDLWVLTTHALHRVSATDLAVKTTIKVPTYLHRFVPLRSGQFLALSQPERSRTPVLSVGEGTLRGTITMPTPDLSIELESGCLLLSFWAGEARAFDGELRPTRDRRELPLGLTPVRSSDQLYFLEAEREVARGVSPPRADVMWLYPTGHLAAFEIGGWRISRKAEVSSVDHLLGTDGDGRIVATDRESNTVSLLEAGTFVVHARWALAHPFKAVDLVGRAAVAYRSSEGRLFLVEWSTAVSRFEAPLTARTVAGRARDARVSAKALRRARTERGSWDPRNPARHPRSVGAVLVTERPLQGRFLPQDDEQVPRGGKRGEVAEERRRTEEDRLSDDDRAQA
ncbi:MAG: hypothetical protein AUH33_02345 [Chloroflexi bacterium 13_1_40CM_68_21]|nr:MAG: hypothetical protein AUH33_02345 [Chloroflexi bacterium 13_1_40CM_68_21]